MRTKFKHTLLLYVSLLLASAALVDANAFDTYRRDHRLIKKRAPATPGEFAGLLGLGGTGSTPTSSADSASAASPSATASAASGTNSATSASPSGSAAATSGSATATGTSSAPSTSGSTGPLGSLVDGLLPTLGSSTTSPSTTTPTPTPTSSSPPHTSEAPHSSASAVAITTSSNGVILTITSYASPSPTSNKDDSDDSPSATITHATWVSILAVGGGIIGAGIIWTVIRKWKFRKSREFDERMAPIDWNPTEDAGDGDRLGHGLGSGLPGSSRRYSNASSFHSSNANEDSLHGHGGSSHGHGHGGYAGQQQLTISDHDFTAGPAHLAPVGGYADLARGPSPQPQMPGMQYMQPPPMHELHRGLSLSRPVPTASPAPSFQSRYDPYGTGMPAHHGGY